MGGPGGDPGRRGGPAMPPPAGGGAQTPLYFRLPAGHGRHGNRLPGVARAGSRCRGRHGGGNADDGKGGTGGNVTQQAPPGAGRLFRARERVSSLWLGACLLLAHGLAGAEADGGKIPASSAVRFNTACAKCHEGQCSGRLSFDSGQMATDTHILRYAGDASPDVRRDLYALLAHMKQTCRYYPISVLVPMDRHWEADLLRVLRSPAEDAYFVPLGTLPAGRYRAVLQFDGEAELFAQVISGNFEIVDRPGLRTRKGTVDFVFVAEREGAHYLRVQAAKPAALVGLEILPLAGRSGQSDK